MKFFLRELFFWIMSLVAKKMLDDKKCYCIKVPQDIKVQDAEQQQLINFAREYLECEYRYDHNSGRLVRMTRQERRWVEYARVSMTELTLEMEDGFNPWRELRLLYHVIKKGLELHTGDDTVQFEMSEKADRGVSMIRLQVSVIGEGVIGSMKLDGAFHVFTNAQCAHA